MEISQRRLYKSILIVFRCTSVSYLRISLKYLSISPSVSHDYIYIYIYIYIYMRERERERERKRERDMNKSGKYLFVVIYLLTVFN